MRRTARRRLKPPPLVLVMENGAARLQHLLRKPRRRSSPEQLGRHGRLQRIMSSQPAHGARPAHKQQGATAPPTQPGAGAGAHGGRMTIPWRAVAARRGSGAMAWPLVWQAGIHTWQRQCCDRSALAATRLHLTRPVNLSYTHTASPAHSPARCRSSISASAGIAGTAAPAAGAGSFRFVTLPMSQPRATQPAGSQAFGQSLAGGSLDAGDGGGWGADAYNPDPASDEPQDEDGGADDAGGDAQVDLDADAAAEAQDWSQRRYSPLEQAAYLSRQLADLQLEVGGSAQGEGQEQGAEEQLEEGEEEEDGALMPRGAAGLPAPSRRGNNEDVEDAQPHQSLHPHGSRMHAWRHEQLQPIEEEQESRKEEAQAAEQAQEEEGNDDAGAGLGTAAQLPSDSVHVGYSLLPRPEEHEEQVSAAGLWEGFANADVLSGRGMAQAATVEVGARGGVRAAAAPGRPAWPSARLRQSPAGSSHRMQLSGEPPSPLAAAAPAGAASAASGAALGPAIEQAGWTGRQMLMQLRHRKPPVPGTSAATVTHGGVAGLSDVVRPSERSPAVERHKGSWGGETTPGGCTAEADRPVRRPVCTVCVGSLALSGCRLLRWR